MKWKRTIIAICAGILALCIAKFGIQESIYPYINATIPIEFDAIILKFDKTTEEMLVKVTNKGSSPFREGDKIRTKYVTDNGLVRPRKRLSVCIQYMENAQPEMLDPDEDGVYYIEPDDIYRNAQYIDGEWKPANY